MKKWWLWIISGVLVLTLASCSTKPKPEAFVPLQSTLISVVYPDKPDQLLKIEWIHTEAIAVLRGDAWIRDPSVLNQEGTLIVQVKDQARDLYQFYTSKQNPSMSYVIVTQKKDDSRLGFTLPSSTLDDFLIVLRDYAESIKVLSYPLTSIEDVLNDGHPIQNLPLLSSLNNALMPQSWIRVNIDVPMATQKRIVLTDDHGDTYTFYTDAGTTEQYCLIVVDRNDQSQQIFSASFEVLNILSRFLTKHPLDDNDYLSQLLRTSVPVSVYLGQSGDYAESKLIELSTSVIGLFQDYARFAYAYNRPNSRPFDPLAKVLFMIKNEDGNYLTVYTAPSTILDLNTDSDCWVSFGKDPFDGSHNEHFLMDITTVYQFHQRIAWSPNGEIKDLDFLVELNDAFVFPAFFTGGMGDGRYTTYTGQLNQGMVDYLNDLEQLDWSVVTLDQFSTFMEYPASLIITTSSGTQYMIAETRNQIIVDEDPSTPGAILYRLIDSSNLVSNGNMIYDLEYLAQLESGVDLSTLRITGYLITHPDDESIELLTYSSSESQTLTDLLHSSTLYLKTYDPFTWFRYFEAQFDLSDDLQLGLFYLTSQKEDYPYGLISLYNKRTEAFNVYYMPMEDFQVLLESYRSFLK
jgi:hypothetical protein